MQNKWRLQFGFIFLIFVPFHRKIRGTNMFHCVYRLKPNSNWASCVKFEAFNLHFSRRGKFYENLYLTVVVEAPYDALYPWQPFDCAPRRITVLLYTIRGLAITLNDISLLKELSELFEIGLSNVLLAGPFLTANLHVIFVNVPVAQT